MTITSDMNDQLMAMAAFRYCLGRRSYIVSCCQEWLLQHWSQLDENSRHVILRDICEALADGNAGMKMDERSWRITLRNLAQQESDEFLGRVNAVLIWKNTTVEAEVEKIGSETDRKGGDF